MDEPCSALDPIATTRIEDLMHELKTDYTIVIVTHNMQQAARVADMTAFFHVELRDDGGRHGILVEHDETTKIFTNPADKRTEDYVTGGSADGTRRVPAEPRTRSRRASRRRVPSSSAPCAATVNALESQDVELCDEVVAFDDEIDTRYHGIERSIEQLLAQQAPVATDLRLVLAVLHNAIHLERIGDQA